jgi:hypothetical protein
LGWPWRGEGRKKYCDKEGSFEVCNAGVGVKVAAGSQAKRGLIWVAQKKRNLTVRSRS